MYLTARSPFNHVLDDFFNTSSIYRKSFSPDVDIYEQDDTLYLHMDVPGVKKEDINITTENGVLRISGEKKLAEDLDNRSRFLSERSSGSFERNFKLNDSLDGESLKAKYVDGTLTLTLKKKEQAIAKRIEIS